VSAADTVCDSPIFGIGRPLSFSELTTVGNMSFELREVHFRDVILRGRTARKRKQKQDPVELAYRIEMRMQLSADRFLTPVHSVACSVQNHPSARTKRLARTMIPVVGDLHLPSTRITVFDQASAESENYNYPRISEVTVSNGGYFSFNQNWAPYRQIRTISQYMKLLRTRMFFDRVEIREMGEGWIGVYAEKNVGTEKSQLMILLARSN
jgi:hypothetical protein